MFSPYQTQKANIIGKHYNKVDIQLIQEKIKSVTRTDEMVAKWLKQQEKNIAFINQMLNQQTMEATK